METIIYVDYFFQITLGDNVWLCSILYFVILLSMVAFFIHANQ